MHDYTKVGDQSLLGSETKTKDKALIEKRQLKMSVVPLHCTPFVV